MDIEVGYNVDTLACRLKVKVRNILAARKTIEKLMDEKRKRGMKLRYSDDYLTRTFYLEARTQSPVDIAYRALKADGNVIWSTKSFPPLARD